MRLGGIGPPSLKSLLQKISTKIVAPIPPAFKRGQPSTMFAQLRHEVPILFCDPGVSQYPPATGPEQLQLKCFHYISKVKVKTFFSCGTVQECDEAGEDPAALERESHEC